MAYDPSKHLINLKGKEYLPVAQRLVWFREQHPDWGIQTKFEALDVDSGFALCRATITDPSGFVMAQASKMETAKGFGDYSEKAETGAIGRALALCGYGTQFAPELEEGDRIVEAPQPAVGRNGNGASRRTDTTVHSAAPGTPVGQAIKAQSTKAPAGEAVPTLCSQCKKKVVSPGTADAMTRHGIAVRCSGCIDAMPERCACGEEIPRARLYAALVAGKDPICEACEAATAEAEAQMAGEVTGE